MKRFLIIIFLPLGLINCGNTLVKNEKNFSREIKIIWVEDIKGNFSFKDNWDYPEGVYKNDFGQISCDGLCPEEIDQMKDENGKIYEDSLNAFYQLVDTTHQFHSIQSESNTPEWAGTNFVTVFRKNVDSTICITQNNVATHSSLNLTITKDRCIPIIALNSVNSTGNKIYYCKPGKIEIDKNFWKLGILKANFEFTFIRKEKSKNTLFWKGAIYAAIDNLK